MSQRHGTRDGFSIDFVFRHPTLDPSSISEIFAVKPRFSWKAGNYAEGKIHKANLWRGRLFEGAGANEYDQALKGAVQCLEDHKVWLEEFQRGHGELDIVFRFSTDLNDDKIFELAFYPELFGSLSRLQATVRLEVWKTEEN